MIAGDFLIITVLIFIGTSTEFPVEPPEVPQIPSSKVLDFLKRFGYIKEDDPDSGALYTEEGLAETLKIVQKFGALEETGVLDNATLALMSSPRCGVPDIVKTKRSKRYAFGSEGWNKRTITYFIANWSPKLGESTVTKNIQVALDTWGKYGHLTFRRSLSPNADIIVAFGSGFHGDRFPFDGQGNILAHAFFPYEEQGFGGDIHFDADENWTDVRNGGDEEGIDFSAVALHELGHSLGLSHSAVPNSVMFPYYTGTEANTELQLGYDDILGMYEMYIRRNIADDNHVTSGTRGDSDDDNLGTKTTTLTPRSTTDFSTEPSTSTSQPNESTTRVVLFEGDAESVDGHKEHDSNHHIPATNSPSLPNICDGSFDAVAILREEVFIFKEQYVWRLKAMSKLEPGYPVPINQMFPNLPKSIKNIDAAYERPDGMIVLFVGNQFWVYDGKSFVENSPRPLSDYGLPPTLSRIDAVQIWARNSKTYFYKEDRFWRYNETAKRMDDGYPKHMERWRGVPHNLDAAATWKGVTYFFKDELFWKFDNDWVMVTEQSPLPTPQIWLGCPEDDRTLRRLIRDEY